MNKHLLYKIISLTLLLAPSAIYAIEPGESSEDQIPLIQACSQSEGTHLGQLNIQDYGVRNQGSFYMYNHTLSFSFKNDYPTGGSVATVYSYDCLSEDLESWKLKNAPSNTQISPEVVKVTTKFILLYDYEYHDGINDFTNTIIDRLNNKIYYINQDVLRNSNGFLNDFAGESTLFWDVKSYQRNVLTVSVRKPSGNYVKTKTFFVKLK